MAKTENLHENGVKDNFLINTGIGICMPTQIKKVGGYRALNLANA